MATELTEQLKRQIGQLFVFGFHGHEVNEDVQALITKYHIGSIILMKRNVKDVFSVRRLVRELQQLAKDSGHEQPLLIGIDQENGLTAAFTKGTNAGTQFPGAMATAATGSTELAEQIAAATAKELKFAGINWAYSPVADVNSDPLNPVIGVRSFGDVPDQVAGYVKAVARGLTSGGVAPSAKHFPGHGDTHIDSHHGLPRIHKTLRDLEATELPPFKALVEDKIATIMIGHMALPLITNDDSPASTSPVLVTELLRENLGFDGVVVTDCLEMDAVADPEKGGCGTEEGALRALQAGADIAMICHTFDRQVGAVKKVYEAVQAGKLTQDRLKKSDEKIRELKTRFAGSWAEVLDEGSAEDDERWRSMSTKHRALAEETYQKSTTILQDPQGIIPLQGRKVVLFTPARESINPAVDAANDGLDNEPKAQFLLENEIGRYAHCQRVVYSASSSPAVPTPEHNGVAIFVTRNAHRAPWQIAYLREVRSRLGQDVPVIVVASCGPYDLLGTGIEGVGYLATYEFTPAALLAAVKVLFGEIVAVGRAPVAISVSPMKKLFAHKQNKAVKVTQLPRDQATGAAVTEDQPIPTPIYQQHATFVAKHAQPPQVIAPPIRTSSSQDQWEVLTEETQVSSTAPLINTRAPSLASLPPGASPPVPSPLAPRSPSPYNTVSSIPPPIPPPKHANSGGRDRERDQPARKRSGPAAGALAALRALDPPREPNHTREQTRSIIEDKYAPSEIDHREHREREHEKKEKKGFWSWDKERDKGHDRERTEREKEKAREEELARIIGWLAATASEDWRLVLEVCDRASSSESNAKEAIRALRREFKYGEASAQLSAARLWALMLRNSSELFIAQSTTRKFLDTLEDVLGNPKTAPVVRDRLLSVVAAAAYASGNKNTKDGFRGLWKRVKPADQSDDGIPFDPDDAMFNPPVQSARHSYYSDGNVTPFPLDAAPGTPTASPTRNRVIPVEEDIRRLFQECKIGSGNAALLSQALAMTRPEELYKKDVIKEFWQKCSSSQELICAQIPWATAGAERSRAQKQQALEAKKRELPHGPNAGAQDPGEATIEEKLLDALLATNAELISALHQYDDLERLAREQQVEIQSRLEVRIDRRKIHQLEHENSLSVQAADGVGRSHSRSPSPSLHSVARSYSPAPSAVHYPAHGPSTPTLPPPPPAPQGPRAPPTSSHSHSRTPSPGTPSIDVHAATPAVNENFSGVDNGFSLLDAHHHVMPTQSDTRTLDGDQPSAKALGKRREEPVDVVEPPKSPDSLFEASEGVFSHQEDNQDSDSEKSTTNHNPWHRPVQYLYDAAAERTQQRIRDGHTMLVNGVH
ncbi:hypothetical protein AX16_007708 [Volvariella volvacea WC 439]|nr:hypothetical protein AX16_007708 [Volvariella volvacea WC 439]